MRKILFSFFYRVVIFLLIFTWVFSGWPIHNYLNDEFNFISEVYANSVNSFRVTEYFVTPTNFSGTTFTLTLDQDLASDYFVIVEGSDGDTTGTGNRGPDENYISLTADPAGTGDLSASGANDELDFIRGNAVNDWVGAIKVVECLADCDNSGFQLLDVQRVAHTGTATSGTDTSGTAWSDINQVALIGGYHGSGCDTAETGNGNQKVCNARIFPSSTATINWTRDNGLVTLSTATSTVHVVEFGDEWNVQRVNVTGSSGGNGADIAAEYDSSTISSVTRANTWVWGTGHAANDGIGEASEGTLITLGDGENQNATETQVSIGMEYAISKDFEVYAFEHPDLAVDYRFKADGDSGNLTVDVTVDSNAATTNRMALVTNGQNGQGTAYPRPHLSSGYLNDTTVRITRRRSGQNFPAWIQGINFSAIQSPSYEQAAYRWFSNYDSAELGVSTTNPSSGTDSSRDVTVDTEFAYVLGWDNAPGNDQWRIEKRRLSDNSLVTAFDTDGVITTNPSANSDRGQEIEVDNSHIFVTGFDGSPGASDTQWRIEKRDKVTGALDSGFGTSGVITVNPSSGIDTIRDIVLDATYVYIAGIDANAGDVQWQIEKRLKTTGALDTNFGTSGVLTVNPSARSDEPYSIDVQGSDVYIGGWDESVGVGDFQWRLEKRTKASGALVGGFGTGGVVTTNPSANIDLIREIKTNSTDIIIVGADESPGNRQWRIEKRSLSSGALVGAFGTSGVVTTNPTSSADEAFAVDIDATDIYIGGEDFVPGDRQWRIEKRSLTNGGLDGTFGSSGVLTINPGSSNDRIRALDVDDTNVYIAGQASTSGNGEWRYQKVTKTNGTSGNPLAAQDTAYQLQDIGEIVRLRYLMTIDEAPLLSSGATFKLQFAARSGTCDTSFTGESYSDVTASTVISYYDNSVPSDGDPAIAAADDPSTGNTINYQDYEELNNFTNSESAIPEGQDGFWDFALYDNGAPLATAYCFRVVESDNTLLDTYTVIPELTTANGALEVDIVDVGGSSVASPFVLFSSLTISFSDQVSTGTLGANDQRIRVTNTTANPQWSLSIAATSGTTALWDGSTDDFDFNDPTASAGDGADADSFGGQLSIDPSGATIAPEGGCSSTGIALGSSSAFSEGVTDAITISSANGTADTSCYFDFTGVNLSQTVPAEQISDSYDIDMTLTIVAI